jgi:hypothetical protein
MSEPIYDSITDPQLNAVVRLLVESLRSRFGTGIVEAVHTWPAPVPTLPAPRYPALVVCWETPRQEPGSDAMDDIESLVLRLDYYLPIVAADRAEMRWKALRAVWKHCIGRLRLGCDPSVDGGVQLLSPVGIASPQPAVAQARFQLAPLDSAWIPMVQGTVTLRTSSQFDDEDFDFPLDDLETVGDTAVIATDSEPDGDEDDPAFTALTDGLETEEP